MKKKMTTTDLMTITNCMLTLRPIYVWWDGLLSLLCNHRLCSNTIIKLQAALFMLIEMSF